MKYILVLRGINVGGHRKIPMADLRAILSSLGFRHVSTYIQSGNAVFISDRDDADDLEREIETRIARDVGFEVAVMIRSRDELAAVIDANPFVDGNSEPTSLHVGFLSGVVDEARLQSIDPVRFAPDEVRLGDRALYLKYPGGLGRSKLTHDLLERRLGVLATIRNWNTVRKVLTMADELDSEQTATSSQ